MYDLTKFVGKKFRYSNDTSKYKFRCRCWISARNLGQMGWWNVVLNRYIVGSGQESLVLQVFLLSSRGMIVTRVSRVPRNYDFVIRIYRSISGMQSFSQATNSWMHQIYQCFPNGIIYIFANTTRHDHSNEVNPVLAGHYATSSFQKPITLLYVLILRDSFLDF